MQYTVFLTIAPLAALIFLGSAITIARAPKSLLSSTLLAMTLCALGFLVTTALGLVWPDEAAILLLAKLGVCLSAFTQVLTLFFTMQLTGHGSWLTAGSALGAAALPAVSSLFVMTEPLHHLIWREISFRTVEGRLLIVTTTGWMHVILVIYSCVVLAASLALLFRETINTQPIYRHQSILAIAGIGIPLVLFVIYTFHLVPGLTNNFTPIGLATGNLFFLASIRQHRLLDLVPIARSILIDDIDDAMIVVDAGGRIVDVNRSARGLLGPTATVIGANVNDHPELRKVHAGDSTGSAGGELSFLVDGALRYFDARVSRIRGRGRSAIGSVIVLRDVTDTHLYLEEKNRLIDELTRAAREIKTLRGIIPICMYCKKVRDDEGYWHQVEQYVGERSNVQFSHGMCPECQKKFVDGGYKMKP